MDAVQAENKISKIANNVLYAGSSSNVRHFFLLNLRPSGLKLSQRQGVLGTFPYFLSCSDQDSSFENMNRIALSSTF